MGWCSGTDIFDDMVALTLKLKITDSQRRLILSTLARSMESHDWDCQSDSGYYIDKTSDGHQLVHEVFRQLHPDWYDDDEEA